MAVLERGVRVREVGAQMAAPALAAGQRRVADEACERMRVVREGCEAGRVAHEPRSLPQRRSGLVRGRTVHGRRGPLSPSSKSSVIARLRYFATPIR